MPRHCRSVWNDGPDGRLSAREFLRDWSANARTTKSIGEVARAVLVSGRSTLIDGTEGLLRGAQYVIAPAFAVDGNIEVGIPACPRLSRLVRRRVRTQKKAIARASRETSGPGSASPKNFAAVRKSERSDALNEHGASRTAFTGVPRDRRQRACN
jgi:hypothetical protein